MKANNTYNVVIANEACNFTATKYNTTLTGFTSSEAANNAAREALRDIAGEMGKGKKVFYSETLNAWILSSSSRGFGSVWYLTAKVVEVTGTKNPETKTITVKRTDWNETAKRLECAGWFYIGTPTATGKTIYRRGNSEIEIIIEEDTTNTPANESEATKQTEKAVISLPRYYTETPGRLRFLARSMADQYRGLNDPEAKRMKALYLDIAGSPEYFLKNNLIKAI